MLATWNLLQKSNPEWDKNVADQPLPSTSSNIEEDALELFLRKNDDNENDRTIQEVLIHCIIDGFDSVQRLGHDTDILQWWKSVKELHPQLFQLSEVFSENENIQEMLQDEEFVKKIEEELKNQEVEESEVWSADSLV